VRRLRFPVVSVGSLSAGGAGKTPLTITLAKSLTKRGLRVDVLSRGYGRAYSNPAQRAARVAPDGAAEEFGDEPLLIARETGVPVYVAAERYDAGLLAEAEAPVSEKSAVHLLDDGFQHRQLYRDVDILLLDQHDWRDSLLPAGNLREPMRAARRATVIAVPAGNPEFEATLRAWGWQGPLWRLYRKMEVPAPPDMKPAPSLHSAASPARSSSLPASKPPACASPRGSPSPTTTATPPPISSTWWPSPVVLARPH
jgi:tetraacyldisaccharide 4'-kinase